MVKVDKRKLYHLDWYLIINGLALFAIGIMNLLSATSSFYSGSLNFIIKQLIAFSIGVVVIAVIINFDYRTIANNAKIFYFISIVKHVVPYSIIIGPETRYPVYLICLFSTQRNT